jgi:hypothetical protein
MNLNTLHSPEAVQARVDDLSSGRLRRAPGMYYRQPPVPSDKWLVRNYPIVKYESLKSLVERENLEAKNRMVSANRQRIITRKINKQNNARW